MKTSFRWMMVAAAVVASQAQTSEQIRRATITGSEGTSGKCTIEVRVDITAEVDIYGDSGRLRTLAGQPATWTRFDCTGPLPYNMTDFRFRGVDGRGSVRLVQDPRNNNSMAVIRIDDPKSGSEGYTFDIEWRGASGGAPTGGFAGGAPATAPTSGTPVIGSRGVFYPRRQMARNVSTEQAMDLCREQVRVRGERDYGLRSIEITSAGVDSSQARRGWIAGTFTERGAVYRRRGASASYRFNCDVDYSSGQVRALEILRADGSAVQALSSSSSAAAGGAAYDQNQVFRACQDAVVARTNRDGYQNVNFSSTAMDPNRNGRVVGAFTATRGPVTDTFDFSCSMDLSAARVLNLELSRR